MDPDYIMFSVQSKQAQFSQGISADTQTIKYKQRLAVTFVIFRPCKEQVKAVYRSKGRIKPVYNIKNVGL